MRGCFLPARHLSRLPELRSCSPRRPPRRCCSAPPAASLVARWSVDAKYGAKRAALALLKEWLAGPAASAGLAADHSRLLACTIGGTESRCELELLFDSLSELESFWASLPPKEHAEWQLRFGACVVDASPSWTILHVMEASVEMPVPAAAQDSPSRPLPAVQEEAEPRLTRTAGGLFILQSEGVEVAAPSTSQQAVELDWKGEPLLRNAGDRMPRIL